MTDLSFAQYLVAAVLLCTSSLLSMVGSATLIKIVRRNLSKVHHQLLLLLSIGDISLSIAIIATPFVLPDGFRHLAMGNYQSCAVTGFLMCASIGFTFIFSAFISINFVF